MKIQDMIKKKRLEQELTQVQLATMLGVSAPSVNKWEKGVSYPDITILPALARTLKTDLNTLLSFQENLSDQEVGGFLNELVRMAEHSTIHEVFEVAMDKVREFPTCISFILYTASVLHGILAEKGNTEKAFIDTIISLYERVCTSDDASCSEQGKELLSNLYMQQKEYDKAERLLAQMPQQRGIDTKQSLVKLYIAKNQLQEAQRMQEESVYQAGSEIYQKLLSLLDIAMKGGRIEDASYIANVTSECARIFDQWEYNRYVALFEYYVKNKKITPSIEIMMAMLKAAGTPWDVQASPLYRSIPKKACTPDFYVRMKDKLLQSILEDTETAFLRDDPQFQECVKQLQTEVDKEMKQFLG